MRPSEHRRACRRSSTASPTSAYCASRALARPRAAAPTGTLRRRAARSDPSRPRRARHPARHGQAGQLCGPRGRSTRADRWPSLEEAPRELVDRRRWDRHQGAPTRPLSSAHDGYVELYRNQGCAAFQYAAHKGSDDVVDKLAPFPLHAHRECRASLQRRGRDGPRDRGRP
jgi:hypothetical protein